MWGNALIGEGVSESHDLTDVYFTRQAADGHVLVLPSTVPQFRGMCQSLGIPEFADDPRFETPQDLVDHKNAIRAKMDSLIAERRVDELVETLIANNVPCAPVVSRSDVYLNPQVAHLGSVIEAEHPDAGTVRYPRHTTQFHSTPASAKTLAPRPGQHTCEVLEEVGFGAGEVDALVQAGAIVLG